MRSKLIALALFISVIYGAFWMGNDLVLNQGTYLAILVGIIPVAICVWMIMRSRTPDQRFLLRLFVSALATRYLLAYVIYARHLESFLGADAGTYDAFGYALLQSWQGLVDPNSFWLVRYTNSHTSGFGMYYFVAALYYFIGQNPLAIQLINCALGAGVAVAGYKISMLVYPSQKAARTVAVLAAFSPSLVLWTSQGLKDGPIMLCLCLCVLYALRLREKLDAKSIFLLVGWMLALYTLRHYAAYIVFVAVAGGLVFSSKRQFPVTRVLQGAVLVVIIGLALSYFGAGEVTKNIDIEQVQRAREWGAKVANTGFGGDVDITDPQAALEFLPLGVLYVLFAPFPWMISNLRQLITLPELIVWWCLMPIMAKGYWFAARHRLRRSFVVCTLILGLTLSFALYQSNAGTAYRHRSQVYVFFFVFIGIGLDLRRQARLEKRARMYRPSPFGGVAAGPVPGTITPNPINVQGRAN